MNKYHHVSWERDFFLSFWREKQTRSPSRITRSSSLHRLPTNVGGYQGTGAKATLIHIECDDSGRGLGRPGPGHRLHRRTVRSAKQTDKVNNVLRDGISATDRDAQQWWETQRDAHTHSEEPECTAGTSRSQSPHSSRVTHITEYHERTSQTYRKRSRSSHVFVHAFWKKI